jgi:hypothetical protein
MSNDDRPFLIPCRCCGGEGFIESGHPTAPHASGVRICEHCHGSGDEEVEAIPVTLDDLDDAALETESRPASQERG